MAADGSVDFHDTLASLVEVAQENNDQIRHVILQVALLLCRLESSVHDALETLREVEDQYLESKALAKAKNQVMAAGSGVLLCRVLAAISSKSAKTRVW